MLIEVKSVCLRCSFDTSLLQNSQNNVSAYGVKVNTIIIFNRKNNTYNTLTVCATC